MKKLLLGFLGVLSLLVVAQSAFAQSINVLANVPFSFKVDKDTLPAGQYQVRAISTGSGALLISNWEALFGLVWTKLDAQGLVCT